MKATVLMTGFHMATLSQLVVSITSSNKEGGDSMSMTFCFALNKTVVIAPRFFKVVLKSDADPVQRVGEKSFKVGDGLGSASLWTQRCSRGRWWLPKNLANAVQKLSALSALGSLRTSRQRLFMA